MFTRSARTLVLFSGVTARYYFSCSYLLEVGSTILPGNWGRIVGMYNTNGFGNPWIQYREDVFDKVRSDEYPDRPSRLKSIFLCDSIDVMQDFLGSTKRALDITYEVSLVDATAAIHRGCMSLVDIQQKETLESFTKKARTYWSGTGVIRPEIVTTSRVKIEARI